MSKTNELHAAVTDESKDRFSSDIEALKSSLAQLREDMTKLLGNTLGAGKSGAGMIRNRASTAVGDLKDRAGNLKDSGIETVEEFGQKIGQRPFMSAAIAMGIGFVLAALLAKQR